MRALLALLAVLPALSLAQSVSQSPGIVSAGQSGAVSWTLPAANTDGTMPANVSGYNLYLAATSALLTALPNVGGGTKPCPIAGVYLSCVIAVPGAATLSYQLPALPPGVYVVTVTAWFCVATACQESTQGPQVGFTVPPPVVPVCYPKIQWPLNVEYGPIPAGISTRYDTYAVWVCNTAAGYSTWANLFSLSAVATAALNYAAGTWTAAQASADCAATCLAPTAAEGTYMQTLMGPAQPKALVAFNGASLTRPVYTTNADGTLNPTPVFGESVAVAGKCDETNRIPSSPAYYSEAAQANATSGAALSVLPAGSFTVCVVSLPIGSN